MKKIKKSDMSDEVWHPEKVGAIKTQMQTTLTDPKISGIDKYRELVVGSKSVSRLLRYEIFMTLIAPLPGAAGLFFRKFFYKSLIGKADSNVIFGKSVTIRHPDKIFIGKNVVIDDYAVLDAKGSNNKGITIGNDVIIGRNTVISCKNGNITIGDNTNIAMNCFIQSAKDVKIGKNVLFSAYCYVIGGGDHKTDRTDIPVIAQAQVVKGISIMDNCLIGAGVKIQDGVTIGNDAIIGTGSVVRDNVVDFSIAAGIPAKVIRMRK